VRNLRRKIEREPAQPERLLTVRGVGYQLRAA
jgi:DNA-binding response OmpR family regulator